MVDPHADKQVIIIFWLISWCFKEFTDSLNSNLINGYIDEVEGMIRQMRAECRILEMEIEEDVKRDGVWKSLTPEEPDLELQTYGASVRRNR